MVRVLIVDDMRENLKLLKLDLETVGYEEETPLSGLQALESILKN